jgi:hypothetical protein
MDCESFAANCRQGTEIVFPACGVRLEVGLAGE